MNKVIYALAVSCAILNSTEAMRRDRLAFENFGKKVLAETISQADSSRLIQLLQNEETFELIALDDDLSESIAMRATSLFRGLSSRDRDDMRKCLVDLDAARKVAETSEKKQQPVESERASKRQKEDDDDSSSKTAAILEVTGALTQACLDITAGVQKQRFEQRKADSLIFAAAADAAFGNKEHPITEAVALHTEAKKPILVETLSESTKTFFQSLSKIFKKGKK